VRSLITLIWNDPLSTVDGGRFSLTYPPLLLQPRGAARDGRGRALRRRVTLIFAGCPSLRSGRAGMTVLRRERSPSKVASPRKLIPVSHSVAACAPFVPTFIRPLRLPCGLPNCFFSVRLNLSRGDSVGVPRGGEEERHPQRCRPRRSPAVVEAASHQPTEAPLPFAAPCSRRAAQRKPLSSRATAVTALL
jgi:hypothetical protein